MIRHTVLFRLKHPAGSTEELAFLDAANGLWRIPGVRYFQKSRQISTKNDYKFVFSMEFADQAAYSAYNDHPIHVAFVRDRWVPEVEAFMEVDSTRCLHKQSQCCEFCAAPTRSPAIEGAL